MGSGGQQLRGIAYALYPVGGGDPRPIPGLEKGDQPLRFSGDGRQLYIRHGYAADASKARLTLLDLETGRKQPWKVLSPADPAGVTDVRLVYPAPDGRGYIYEYDRQLSDLFLVESLK